MNEGLNYCRHIGDPKNGVKPTKMVIFFQGYPYGVPPNEYHHWAFWRVPHNEKPHTFAGRLIGECDEQRCIRKHHSPKLCNGCRIYSEV